MVLTPQEKEAFELSAVLSLAENVRRQEKELRELRNQLEDAKDEKQLKELRNQLEDASKAEKELEDLRNQLEQASKQEKELQNLRAQLEEANQREKALKEEEKELRERKKQLDQGREDDLQQARGIIPQLAEVEAMAQKARKEISQVSVSGSDSNEVLALAVMGAAQNAEQLGEMLGRIEQKLHEIIEGLQPPAKRS